MKKLIIVFGLFLTSCGTPTTNIYIYSSGDKPNTVTIDSTDNNVIDTIMLDGNDSVSVHIDKEEEG